LPHGELIAPAAINLARKASFQLGHVEVRPATRQVIKDGLGTTIEPRVMQVLVALAEAEGEVVSRDQLIESCWGGTIVGDNAIHRVVSRVRELAASVGEGSFTVETITKVGYRLVADRKGALAHTTPLRADASAWPERSEEHWGVFGLVTFWRFRSRLRGGVETRTGTRQVRARTALALFVVAILLGSAIWFAATRWRPAEPEPVSLAVLPFRNLSAGEAYFAEGVAEEILTQLARQPGFRVAGRTSSWMFREDSDPRQIGERLDVAYLLEGSVRRAGERVRVDVALVDTRDGMRRWSHSFEGGLDDVLSIQGRIGSSVANSLSRRIVQPLPLQHATRRGDVYNLYLTARGLLRSGEPAKVETAAELLRRAVRLDPQYAAAWALLADATAERAFILATSPERMGQLQEEAGRYAERAIRLAPNLAEGHSAAARQAADAPTAIRHLEAAVRLDPNNAELWHALGSIRGVMLDFEGELEALRRAAEIDPFWVRSASYAVTAWLVGAREEALRFERRMIHHHPEPLGRLNARIRVAAYRLDWSEAYRLVLEADRLRPLQVRAREAFPEPIFLRLRLGLYAEAAPIMSFPVVTELARGEAPPLAEILRQVGSPAGFWQTSPVRNAALLRLNQHGRGSDILTLYDAVYRSPAEMAAVGVPLRFISDAGQVIVALRDAGRVAEADRLLSLVDRELGRALAQRRVSFDTIQIAARIRALQGRREEALQLLERAVRMGWQWHFVAISPRLTDDPVFRSIRNEPRLRRLDAVIQNAIARERQEVRLSPS
jgi:TolB-like protein/DNA-binding winged helix-turn-helix (wHTH) protein